ncbi:arylformamidase [Geomicrobium sp. JCM 19039]|uniref:arylformamidase n=1 Tax=Geomicrobium sp. JCM 19039 TaxID=1460636 RepID=UPI00045F466B|nr:arylformamidase [Geomicrobium sp. JCM 19039]GAK11115.1 kynurenine formamidase [Geomicrobium sp. JCM 19039]
MSEWIDITQPLTGSLAHWPGDIPFTYKETYSHADTGSVAIGQIQLSLHSGTHADAPYHAEKEGQRMGDVPIEPFIGPAQVVDLSAYPTISKEALQQSGPIKARRVLLKTKIPNDANRFPDSIAAIDEAAVDYLFEQEVKLIGVDVPSVDPLNSKSMLAHKRLNLRNMYILENLMLDHVETGGYFLSALPLAITHGDGSPVRAVLKKQTLGGTYYGQ